MSLARRLFCSAAFAAVLLIAQNPAPPADPTIVRLNVIAVDSGGQPVTDLTADDFRVTDQGKPERVLFFRRSGIPQPAAAPGAHEYSNSAASPHTTAILFDLMNQGRADRVDAARKIGRSLQQLESGDSVYLYVLSLEGAMVPIHAMQPASGDKTWTQQVEKQIDQSMQTLNRARPAGMSEEDAVKKTYVALETLATQLAAIPGRRDILWVTNGVPMVFNTKGTCNGDFIECALYIAHIAVTLERAGVALNPLSYTSGLGGDTTRDIELFAGLTGGRAFYGDDMRTVLATLAADARASYFIAYDPQRENLNSKFHKVRVTSERKGVKIQTRQRYYAIPDQRPAATLEQAALMSAAGNPADLSDIGLRIAVTPAPAGQKAVHLQVRIEPADLMLVEQGDHFDGQVTVMFADYGASGPVGAPAPSSFNLRLTREQHDKVMKEGLAFPQDHPIDDTVRKVRLIVYDHGSRALGSLTVPVAAAPGT
jgi:VWFA-related protein